MFKAGKIQEYRFLPSDLIANAAGSMTVYSNTSINGTIEKIRYDGANYTATGSIIVALSGNRPEFLYNLVSGTVASNVGSSAIVYPYAYGTNNNNTGSLVFIKQVANGPLVIFGSGLGAGTSGLGITIFYI